MIPSCLICTSAGVVQYGPRSGSLWCALKRQCVNPDSACPAYPEAHQFQMAIKREMNFPLSKAEQLKTGREYPTFSEAKNSVRNRMEVSPSQRVLVKSAVESQFETNSGQARPSFSARLYPEGGTC